MTIHFHLSKDPSPLPTMQHRNEKTKNSVMLGMYMMRRSDTNTSRNSNVVLDVPPYDKENLGGYNVVMLSLRKDPDRDDQ